MAVRTEDLVKEIILEQSLIIGEKLARSRAIDSGAVTFDSPKLDDIKLLFKDRATVLGKITESYQEVFGQASVEVCQKIINKHLGD